MYIHKPLGGRGVIWYTSTIFMKLNLTNGTEHEIVEGKHSSFNLTPLAYKFYEKRNQKSITSSCCMSIGIFLSRKKKQYA
jgi:hypothetical protein